MWKLDGESTAFGLRRLKTEMPMWLGIRERRFLISLCGEVDLKLGASRKINDSN